MADSRSCGESHRNILLRWKMSCLAMFLRCGNVVHQVYRVFTMSNGWRGFGEDFHGLIDQFPENP